jgi:hypothetical protein
MEKRHSFIHVLMFEIKTSFFSSCWKLVTSNNFMLKFKGGNNHMDGWKKDIHSSMF